MGNFIKYLLLGVIFFPILTPPSSANDSEGPCGTEDKYLNLQPFLHSLPRNVGNPPLQVAQPGAPLGAGASSAFWQDNRCWEKGDVIRIGFIGGSESARKMIKDVSIEWLKYANSISFEFVGDADSTCQVAIAFDPRGGSWSYLGTDTLHHNFPQMNFGWLDGNVREDFKKGTILHEFGHLLGLNHEHLSPDPTNPIEFDESKVIAYFAEHDGWSPQKTRDNVLRQYAAPNLHNRATIYDPDSIMLYYFPAELMKNGQATKENDVLSKTDKEWAKLYYGKSPTTTNVDTASYEAHWEMSDTFIGTRTAPRWKWSVSLQGPGTEHINRVVYHLHPSFKPSTYEVNTANDGFELDAEGWGTFVLLADVYWEGRSKPTTSKIPLRFRDRPFDSALAPTEKGYDLGEKGGIFSPSQNSQGLDLDDNPKMRNGPAQN